MPLALLLLAGAVRADEHPLRGVALVIGQSNYSGELPKLANPKNDADAMDGLLGRLGFAVTEVQDGDHAKLSQALTDFETAAKDADVALVYYSGHGIEAGGENYLVPIDADLSSAVKAGATLLPVSDLLDNLAKTVPVTIVLLDACRTNAFPAGTMIQAPGAAQPVAAQSTGLGELRGPTPATKPGVSADNLGMVIGFAASPGEPALDGAPGEPNSPYAAALLKHLAAGGYSFGDLMTMVSEEVYLKTNARQLPWVNSSLRRVLNFGKPAEADDPDQAAIKTGRRQLLLSIAGAPDATRASVETVAAAQGVPLGKLYAMLNALGVNTSDPDAIEQQLEDGATRIKKLTADTPAVAVDDADLTKLVALATEADSEGAVAAALDFWTRASDRAKTASATLGSNANDQHKKLAEIFARTGDAASLAADFTTAAARYADAVAEVAGIDDSLANAYKTQQAFALEGLGEQKGGNDPFDQSLKLYDEVLTYLDGQPDDDRWAEVSSEFGTALAAYGNMHTDSDEYLQDAQHAFEQVANIWTKETKPNDWARTQNNLGNVYASLGDRGNDPQLWQQAAGAYRSALEVWTENSMPFEWARAEINVGTVLRSLGNYGKDPGQLKAAVAAYQSGLRQWTRQKTPYNWASAQNDLGNALGDLGKLSKDPKSYAAAIDAFNAALEISTEAAAPLQWATIQNNLGATYFDLGRTQKGAAGDAMLKQAVAAYKLSLDERTQDSDPRDWALTQYNIGLVLTEIGTRGKDADAWNDATLAFNAALEVYTQDDTPNDWADCQEGLGWALANLGALQKDRSLVQQGRDAMQAASDYYADQNGAADYYETRLKQIDKMLKAVS